MVSEPGAAPEQAAGPACEASPLPLWQRLAITFAVLFALKWTLPLLGVPAPLQVVMLLVAATGFIWRFWWRCSPDHRGALILGGSLWAAGLLKIALGS